MDPTVRPSPRQQLSAFADGELGPAAARDVRHRLLRDPSSAEDVRRLQQLTAAARRAVRGHTPPASDDLRARLRHLAGPAASVPVVLERTAAARPWWASVGRLAMAAAVALAAGVWLGRRTATPAGPVGRPDTAVVVADVVPAAVVAEAESIHGICGRLAEGLHAGGYPADVAAIAPDVERDLHSAHPYPDLSPIGYRYRGAGPCGKPMADTAHLLYRSVRPGSVAAVSVFVQPWHDQYAAMTPGRLYTVSVATSPFPMLAWRTDRVVYFLLADGEATERAAAALVRDGPATRR